MHSNKIEQYKKTLYLTKRQNQILIGLMLGDGHIESSYRPEIARLKISYRATHKEYIDWLWQEFREWVLRKPKLKEQTLKGKMYKSYWFTTVSHQDFAKVWKKWYLDRRKIVPVEELKKLNSLGLAIWFMDDGSIKSRHHKSVFLNTQGFKPKEVTLLQDVLENKFGIHSSTRKDKNGLQIYISQENSVRLKEIINPYILQSMRYKLNSRANRMPKK